MFFLTWWKETLIGSLFLTVGVMLYLSSLQGNSILKKENEIKELITNLEILQGVQEENQATIGFLHTDIIDLRKILIGNDNISSETIGSLKKIIKEFQKTKHPKPTQTITVTVYEDCNVSVHPDTKIKEKDEQNDFIKISIDSIGKF